MNRTLVALCMLALCGCGGDDVNFDFDNPPRWLRKVDGMLPAKPLRTNEVSGNCVGVPFQGSCTADVARSSSMVRKARFAVGPGQEVRVTYTPNGEGSEVVVSARPEVTVPVRKGGGTMRFDCVRTIATGCTIALQ